MRGNFLLVHMTLISSNILFPLRFAKSIVEHRLSDCATTRHCVKSLLSLFCFPYLLSDQSKALAISASMTIVIFIMLPAIWRRTGFQEAIVCEVTQQ
jgi:hypothetical protein